MGNLITDGLGGNIPSDPGSRVDFFTNLTISLETAIFELSTGKIKSYSLNTGQTTQTVSKKDINSLREVLDWAYARLDYFNERFSGGGTIVVR